MGPTRTRYTYGSACAYRMTTACSGAIERPVTDTIGQARSNLGQASTRPGQKIHRHRIVRLHLGDNPAARRGR